MTTIALQNASTIPLPRPDILEIIAAAVDLQVRRDFAHDYGLDLGAWTVVAGDQGDIIARIIDDDPNAPGALAYHDDPSALPVIVILAKTILDNGGTWIDGDVSISSAFSHEVLELIADPACNRWASTAPRTLVAIEVCDPVEEVGYTIAITNDHETVAVAVSNYVLPAWFDPSATAVQFDRLGHVDAPGKLHGGYAIIEDGTGERQVTGEMAPWKAAVRAENPFSRTYRREVMP